MRLARLIVAIAASSLLLLGPAGARADDPIEPAEPIMLFNGENLDGFYTYLSAHGHDDPNGVFTVQEGMIRISGQDFGGLITEDEYANYHLIVEFRWGDETWPPRERNTRDSGILLHCVGPDGNSGHWMASHECQIIEGGVGDFIVVRGSDSGGEPIVPSLTARVSRDRDGEWVWDPEGEQRTFDGGRINWYGRDPDWEDVLGFRGDEDVESPAGEWTRVEVICDGDRITNIVNGTVVNEAYGSSLTAGKILIQSEGAEIFVRRVELRPIEREQAVERDEAVSQAPTEPEPGFRFLFDGATLDGWHTNPEPIGHGTGGLWQVQDGAITGEQDPPGSGNGGILLTDEQFGDFELIIEAKPDWGICSGIFLRSNERGQCYQVMVDYHDNGNVGEIYGEGIGGFTNRTFNLQGVYDGGDEPTAIRAEAVEGATPTIDVEQWGDIWRIGDWNTIRVRVEGSPPTITTCINGTQVTTYTAEEEAETLAPRGHIAVQVHGGSYWPEGARCRWRNIQVRELE